MTLCHWQLRLDGATRIVLLTKHYAFKFPNVRSWPMFLQGLISNMHECLWAWRRLYDPRLCPIVMRVPGGWLNVQRRARLVTEEQFKNMDRADWKHLPVEWKRSSFGWLDHGGIDQIVAVDYG